MRRRYVQIGTELFEVGPDRQLLAPVVIDDIEPFVATTGKLIAGRRQWRDHLKEIGAVEMGHADLEKATTAHQARKAASLTRPRTPAYQGETKPIERSKTTCRLLERLEGRPAPDRKTLIKMAIEERKRG